MTSHTRSPTGHDSKRHFHCQYRPRESSDLSGEVKNCRECRPAASPRAKSRRKERVGNAPVAEQVDELLHTLHGADQAMSDNEHMLSDYRRANARQTWEMDELRSELQNSKEMLHSIQSQTPRPHSCSAAHSPPLCSSCVDAYREECDKGKLRSELERERLARERAELNSFKVISLLDTSLRNHTSSIPLTDQDDIGKQLKDLKQDLLSSTKELECKHGKCEQKLKEIDGKMKETSKSTQSDAAFDELLQQVSQLKDELWQRNASEKRRKMLQQIRNLESDLSSERQHHSSSVLQTHKVQMMVKQLEQELELAKEKDTNQNPDECIGGDREDIFEKVEKLQEALASSEKQRVSCIGKCGQLSQECFKQEVGQEALREKIKDIESRMQVHKNDRRMIKARQQLLSQELSEKMHSESQFKDQCDHLERQITELMSVMERREAEFIEVLKKLEGMEEECMEGRVVATQLRAEIKTSEDQKSFTSQKITALEEKLEDMHHQNGMTKSELRNKEQELTMCRGEIEGLSGELEKEKKKALQYHQQKKTAQVRISKLEHQIEDSKNKQMSSFHKALQALKKLKSRCQELEQQLLQVHDERDCVIVQTTEMQKQLGERQALLQADQCKLSQMEKDNSELNIKLNAKEREFGILEAQNGDLRNNIIELEASCAEVKIKHDKSQYELSQTQLDSENQKQEILLVKQSLEQSQLNEKRLSNEVIHSKEKLYTEVSQLQSNLDADKSERLKLIQKCKRLLCVNQSLTGELKASNLECNQCADERKSLERKLEEIQSTFSNKEQDMLKKEQIYKLMFGQEMKKVKQKHLQVIGNLQQTISSLEIELTGEQATLQDARRQQLKVLDDQQRVYADDLSKSLENTERLRMKYLKAKKLCEDKEACLESEITESNGENENLRQKLSESQAILIQQVEEHELLLREASKEVDTIVHQMGLRVDVPMFPTIIGDETDVKKSMADMLAKLKWLQKEVTDLLAEETKLKHKVCFGYTGPSCQATITPV